MFDDKKVRNARSIMRNSPQPTPATRVLSAEAWPDTPETKKAKHRSHEGNTKANIQKLA